MGRRARHDEPGSWHHVLDRGLAKPPLFEDRVEIRTFLSRLAREVRPEDAAVLVLQAEILLARAETVTATASAERSVRDLQASPSPEHPDLLRALEVLERCLEYEVEEVSASAR